MPQTHTLVRKGRVNGPGNAYERSHECGASCLAKFTDIGNVFPGDDQHVPRVELSNIHKRHCQFVCTHNTCCSHLLGGLAEYAVFIPVNSPSSASNAHGRRSGEWTVGELSPATSLHLFCYH